MKGKIIAAFMLTVIAAFCIFAVIPMGETDATDISYRDEVGAIPRGAPYSEDYTFGGQGYWNDTLKTAPHFTIQDNCTTTTPTVERVGSSYNWGWRITFDVTPTYSGFFRCVVQFTTSGGFLSSDDNYSLMVIGSGLYNYTIVYDANGGSGAPAGTTFTDANNSASYTISSTIPTKSTDEFLGWSTSMNASAADYAPGSTYTISAGTTTFYAVWKESQVKYSVKLSQSYYGNGTMKVTYNGTDYTSTQSINIYVDPGSSVKFTYIPSAGYHFTQWSWVVNVFDQHYSYSNPTTITVNGNISASAQSEADVPTFTFNFVSNNPSYGTVSTSSMSITQVNTVVMVNGNELYPGNGTSVLATPATEDAMYRYTFLGWYDSNNVNLAGSIHQYNTSQTFTAKFARELKDYTVSFVADPEYGSFVPVDTLTVSYNTEIHVNGSTVTINNVDVSAVANAPDGVYSYSFVEWSVEDGDMITSDITITATFDRNAISSLVHWSNGMMNGSVSFVFAWPSEEAEIHNLSAALYTGGVNPDYSTTWTTTGFIINLSLSYPMTSFAFDLQLNGASVMSATTSVGKWDTYELTIDAENGTVWMVPLRTFTSFIEYTTLDSQRTVLFDFSDHVTNAAIDVIDHEDAAAGEHVRFSVTNTDVFLNTYGIVMNNPAINVYNYFPQYEKVRVNFYAFAIYGNAFSVNGAVFDVVNGQVTVQYVTDSDGNKILATLDPEATPDAIKSRTLPLNNIFVTWDGERCSLTFQSERFTVDLGPYATSNELVSFTGIWYFTSVIYEPTTTTAKELGEWKVLPDLDMNQMLLIFLGILALVGSVAWIKVGGGLVDAMVMLFAGITAFILLV